MKEYTKESPGCYHRMIKYLSDITGISTHKEIDIPFEKIKRFSQELHFVLNGKDEGQLVPRFVKGNVKILCKPNPLGTGDQSFIIPFDTKFDRIFQKVLRSANEFNVPIGLVGSYTDSLGGGWTQKVELWQVNDKFFANMECSCC